VTADPEAPPPANGAVPPPAPEEWVECWRGIRRTGQVIVRYLRDAGLVVRNAAGLPGVTCTPQQWVLQTPASQAETAKRLVEGMKKAYPVVFAPGKGGG
jgi:hypothetical protein